MPFEPVWAGGRMREGFYDVKQGNRWQLLRGAEGDSRVGREDMTQGGMIAEMSELWVEVEV